AAGRRRANAASRTRQGGGRRRAGQKDCCRRTRGAQTQTEACVKAAYGLAAVTGYCFAGPATAIRALAGPAAGTATTRPVALACGARTVKCFCAVAILAATRHLLTLMRGLCADV